MPHLSLDVMSDMNRFARLTTKYYETIFGQTQPAEQQTSVEPDLERIAYAAHPQHLSPLFGSLPAELRQLIYVELWRTGGLKQHVIAHAAGYTYGGCISNQDGEDQRQVELLDLERHLAKTPSGDFHSPLWARRLASSWGVHWQCEELSNYMLQRAEMGPFLPILLACKRL